MKRRLFTKVSVISLVTFVVVSVLGLHSYVNGARLTFAIRHYDFDFVVWEGRALVWIKAPKPPTILDPWTVANFKDWPHKESRPWWRRHIDLDYNPVNPGYGLLGAWSLEKRDRYWDLPCWPTYLATVVMPASWLFRRFRRRPRTSTNACATCGYDLRATPLRCPECGTESKKPEAILELSPS
jgi:hypothetical protein